ncbi:MAG: hypothetical protein K1X64_11830 [Myxococcaceae bacterium]|nr:hypothetical protein [Myxococcaceae bacterium]
MTGIVTWKPISRFGLTAQLGAKTGGYVMSQPLAAGPFGFGGISVDL